MLQTVQQTLCLGSTCWRPQAVWRAVGWGLWGPPLCPLSGLKVPVGPQLSSGAPPPRPGLARLGPRVCPLPPRPLRRRHCLSVMSFPAEGVESAIKNNVEDVRLFLDSKHPGRYTVYNLSPRTYRPSRFHSRVSPPPALSLLDPQRHL